MLILNNTKLCGLPHNISSKLICVSTSSLPDPDRGRRPSRDKRRNRRSSSFNRTFSHIHITQITTTITFENLLF